MATTNFYPPNVVWKDLETKIGKQTIPTPQYSGGHVVITPKISQCKYLISQSHVVVTTKFVKVIVMEIGDGVRFEFGPHAE